MIIPLTLVDTIHNYIAMELITDGTMLRPPVFLDVTPCHLVTGALILFFSSAVVTQISSSVGI